MASSDAGLDADLHTGRLVRLWADGHIAYDSTSRNLEYFLRVQR